jgi:N utilization substance protein B
MLRESLRRKRASRIAAIQAIYTREVRDKPPSAAKLLEQIHQQWTDSIAAQDGEWPMMDKPENALLESVLLGTLEKLAEVDELIATRIKENWKAERMDPVMRAILRCAVYELAFQPERKTHTLLDEYVTIAGGFFDGQELGYIHSALQQLGTELRPVQEGDA